MSQSRNAHAGTGRRALGALAVCVATTAAVSLLLGGCTDMEAAGPSGEGHPPASVGQATTVPSPTTAERNFASVNAAVDSFVTDQGLNGAGLVVVDREEGIVHEHYAGEFSADRVSLIASSSKMITAGVLMALADEGVLDVDDPIAEQVDWDGVPADITPAQLLSNSSGLVGLTTDPLFPPYICQYVAEGTLEECGRQIVTTADDDDRVIPPDTEFRYGGGQWQVAGAVAEEVSGRSWADLVEQIYVGPCDVASLGYNNHFAQPHVLGGNIPFEYPAGFRGDVSVLTPTLNPNMEGGAFITAPDYAQLLLMHLRGGRCGDNQVLSADAVDRMHTERVVATYGGQTKSTETGGYGLGWWIDLEDPSHIEDGGAFGAVPWLDLTDGYGVYLVVEATNRVGDELADVLRPMIDEQMSNP